MKFLLKSEPEPEPYLPECLPASAFHPLDPRPGLYANVPDEPYFSTRGEGIFSQSWTKPKRPGKKIRRRARVEGSAANDYIMRPSIYRETYAEIDEQHDLRTKIGKQGMAEAEAAYPGMKVLRPREWQAAHHAYELVYDNPETRDWLEAKGEVELTMVAELDDVLWKGRMDKDTPMYHSDLKLFNCQDIDSFIEYWVPKFGYDVQCALYSDLYQDRTEIKKPWRWAVVSLYVDQAWLSRPAPGWVYMTGRRHYQDIHFVRTLEQGL